MKRKVILIFVLLLITHLIHIIEEVLGNVYFIESLYDGLINFLIINIALWIIPIILLFYVIKKKKIVYYLSIIYGLIMIFDGLDHIIRKDSGFYSGLALVILGLLLIYHLWEESKGINSNLKHLKSH